VDFKPIARVRSCGSWVSALRCISLRDESDHDDQGEVFLELRSRVFDASTTSQITFFAPWKWILGFISFIYKQVL
jgi:hypothetical protein